MSLGVELPQEPQDRQVEQRDQHRLRDDADRQAAGDVDRVHPEAEVVDRSVPLPEGGDQRHAEEEGPHEELADDQLRQRHRVVAARPVRAEQRDRRQDRRYEADGGVAQPPPRGPPRLVVDQLARELWNGSGSHDPPVVEAPSLRHPESVGVGGAQVVHHRMGLGRQAVEPCAAVGVVVAQRGDGGPAAARSGAVSAHTGRTLPEAMAATADPVAEGEIAWPAARIRSPAT